ncbi:UNVERIFIED_CONTAM: hypothetical protein Sangu_1556300 [Sesamum angustifolium]|uniref:Uncharacterized protein n=1 Tax=Sesamum angustifolium TaxID=2727405 RepID=A0AAW2MVB6_9LAMI
MLLQQQYREKGFTKYSELISCILVAEQNNELLLKNHKSRLAGSAPFPEVNVATRNHYNHEPYRGRGRNHSHGYGRGRGYRSGHWSRTCRTPEHLIDLYQESLKNKNKKIETNFVDDESDGYIDMTHLDVADFFADPNGKIDHLIGDGSVSK